jgi:hypothetical protein
MKIEDQVTSLELSQRLKELGVEQESLFYWNICDDCTNEYDSEEWNLSYGQEHGRNYSAFNVAELGEMLPDVIYDEQTKLRYVLKIYKLELMSGEIHWRVEYVNTICTLIGKIEETEVNARAQMLIHLIENNLLKL